MNINFEQFKNPEGIVKNGLPASVYTDDQFASIENQTLFRTNWVFVGFAHEQIGRAHV